MTLIHNEQTKLLASNLDRVYGLLRSWLHRPDRRYWDVYSGVDFNYRLDSSLDCTTFCGETCS